MGEQNDLHPTQSEVSRSTWGFRRNSAPQDVTQLWSGLLREPGVRLRLALFALASVASGLLEALLLALLANLAVTVGGGASLSHLPWPLSLVGHLTISQAALVGLIGCAIRLPCQHFVAHIPAKIVADTQVRLRTRVSEAYANATWLARVSLPEGRLHETALAQADQTAFALLMAVNAASAGLSLIVLVGAALMLNPPAAVAIIVAVGMLYSLFRPLTRRVRIHADAHAAANLKFASLLGEAAQLNAETQVFGVTQPVLGRLRVVIRSAARPLQRTTYLHGILPAIYQSAALGIVLLGMLVANGLGRSSLAAMGSVVLLLLRALSYGVAVQAGIQRATDAGAYAAEVVRTLSKLEGATREVGSETLSKVSEIELRSVGHSYGRGGDDALADVSLMIELGTVIGVVGPSGSGKSTLAHVLCRLLRPAQGEYLVNGQSSINFSEESWSRSFAFVPQDGHLLTASLADNIRFHRDGFSDDEVRAAATAAHIDAEIMSWPAQYQTVVGQRFEALSGGQRQRICLARALLGQPAVLVLDEPTSALDARSEQLIVQSLRGLTGRSTMVVITHRSSLLELCDRVIYFHEGRLEHKALALANERTNEGVTPNSAPVDRPSVR